MNDLEFIRRCVNNEKQAWDEFVKRYSRLIYSYIHYILKLQSPGSYQGSEIDDIFQQIFLMLCKENFKKLRSFQAKNGCSFASWLRQVVVNYTIDYLRRSKQMLSLDQENSDGTALKDIIEDPAQPVDAGLITQEQADSLVFCIDRLEPKEKLFLELHLNRQISMDKIRKILRISRGAADMRKNRILEKLRDCFRSKGFALEF